MASFENFANFVNGSLIGTLKWVPGTSQTVALPPTAPPSALATLRSTNSAGVTEWTTESAPQRLILGTTTTQALTAGSTIAVSSSVAVPISAASAITLTSNPQIAAGVDRQVITIVNVGSFGITIANSNGNLLGQAVTLLPNKTLTLMYLTAISGWIRTDSTVLDTPSPIWTSAALLNGFTNLGSGFQSMRYSLHQGVVHIQGALAQLSSTTAQTAVFQLPVGLRPAATLVLSQNGTGVFRVDVNSDGNVVMGLATTGAIYPTVSASFLPN